MYQGVNPTELYQGGKIFPEDFFDVFIIKSSLSHDQPGADEEYDDNEDNDWQSGEKSEQSILVLIH